MYIIDGTEEKFSISITNLYTKYTNYANQKKRDNFILKLCIINKIELFKNVTSKNLTYLKNGAKI